MLSAQRIAPSLVLALVLCSCAPAVAPGPGGAPTDENKQIDGDTTQGYQNVVWLYMWFERGGPHYEGQGSTCTGTMIQERVVLTAKHCVEDYDGVRASEIYVGFGDDIEITFAADGTPSGHEATAVDIVRAPGEGIDSGNDLAILILDRHFNSPAPAAIVRNRMGFADEPFIGVGYGVNDVAADTSGEKLIGRTTLAWLEEKEIVTTPSLQGACYGDSGGPLFTEEGRLWGVLSRGRTDDPSADVTQCNSGDYYVRTDAWLDLIDREVRRGIEISMGIQPLPTLAPPPELGTVPRPGVFQTVSGTVAEGANIGYQFVVPGDCKIELELTSTSGDADLYGDFGRVPDVEGMPPCVSDSSDGVDACTIDGHDRYDIEVVVHGYVESDYTLGSRIVPL